VLLLCFHELITTLVWNDDLMRKFPHRADDEDDGDGESYMQQLSLIIVLVDFPGPAHREYLETCVSVLLPFGRPAGVSKTNAHRQFPLCF